MWNLRGKILRSIILLSLSLSMFGYVYSQIGTNMLESRISVNPPRVKIGEVSTVKVVIKNPFPEEKITLKAVATYEIDGQQYTAESNEVVLSIDRSFPVGIAVNIGTLSLVENSVKYDGQTVAYTLTNTNNGSLLTVMVTIPNDNQEHEISFAVRR